MPDWIWQGVLTSLGAALLWLIGDRLFKRIWEKSKDQADLVRYRLTVLTCFVIITAVGFAAFGYAPFRKPPAESAKVTPENIEENIKLWAEHLRMNLGPANEPDTYFAYTVSLPDMGQPVEVFRSTKEKPGYLQFKALITVAPEHQLAFAKMSEVAVQRVIEQLDLDIERANLGCSFGVLVGTNDQRKKTIKGAFLQRGVFIANLNEVYFSDTFDQVTRGVAIVQSSIRLAATSEMASAK